MVVAYDGTQYGGWQVQQSRVSIQSLIEQTLFTILQTPTSLSGSGRTDAGVHALAQVAHFTTQQPINPAKTLLSLNALLPGDIRIMHLESTSPTFHARFSALAKTYHYRLHLDPIPDPFKRHYAYHVQHPVDLTQLQDAASHFVGTHDFSSFANSASRGSAANDAVRTLHRLDVILEPGGARLEFEGNGFLYKMVRNIVGTLLDICANKIARDALPHILKAKDRRLAGRAAPPHGLHLIAVRYDK